MGPGTFHLLEKGCPTERERIPDKKVARHAKGSGAYGDHVPTSRHPRESTRRAKGVQARGPKKTEASCAFEPWAGGGRGSRRRRWSANRVRGLALRFYTEEGNWGTSSAKQHAGFVLRGAT